MTKNEFETLVAEKFKEIVDILKEFDSKNDYLSLAYVNGSIMFGNGPKIHTETRGVEYVSYYENLEEE